MSKGQQGRSLIAASPQHGCCAHNPFEGCPDNTELVRRLRPRRVCAFCQVRASAIPTRRRYWTRTTKARIVAEACAAGASIDAVARRFNVPPYLLRRWIRSTVGATIRTPLLVEHRCATCGVIFKASRSDAKYCSAKCRQKAYRLHKLIPLWLGLVDWAGIVERLFWFN